MEDVHRMLHGIPRRPSRSGLPPQVSADFRVDLDCHRC